MNGKFAKTKILATLGPATDSEEMLKQLIEKGVDGFRLNFSHGSHEYFDQLFDLIHSVRESLSKPIPILQDLQGPKIRVGDLKSETVNLITGETIAITTEDITGDAELISASYMHLVDDAETGDTILIDDGVIRLSVMEKKEDRLICRIEEGGNLKPHKGINLPGMKLRTPAVTEKDYSDLEFTLKKNIDFVALSFVRSAGDIKRLKSWLKERNKEIPVIAKIEKKEAVESFDEILNEADGIMIARGDLGVELPPEDVPLIQKEIILKCNEVGKMVITATQMFESMVNNPVPTRAEASDVANAVWDGTDVVMLSAETSIGKYPVEAVDIMNNILIKTEGAENRKAKINFTAPDDLADNLFDAMGMAVANMAKQVKAKLIVVFTNHGRKAKVISKFKPCIPVAAFANEFDVLNNLNLHWGILPFYMEDFSNEEKAINDSIGILKKNSLVEEGDIIIFTSGAPYTDRGRKNWIRFKVI